MDGTRRTAAEIVVALMEARGDYNIKIIEVRQETEHLTIARVSFDWRLNACEKHVEDLTVYLIHKDSGEYELMP